MKLALLACAILAACGAQPSDALRGGPSATSSTSTSSSTTSPATSKPATPPPTAGAVPTAAPASISSPVEALGRRIMGCESAGDPGAPPDWTATNPRSTASGAAQYLDSTWAGWGGYRRAKDAPPAVQLARFHDDLATIGTGPWRASRACWA